MADKLPNETFDVTYCDKCGSNDNTRRLSTRHFRGGSLCKGGTLYTVTYRRDDSTIRPAKDDEQ